MIFCGTGNEFLNTVLLTHEEVFTVVSIQNTIFWYMILCNLVDIADSPPKHRCHSLHEFNTSKGS